MEKWNEEYSIYSEGQGKEFDIELNEEYLENLTPEKVFPFKMYIPEVNFEWIVNSGVDDDILKLGPGHITGTALPGQYGRCSVAAHRTTYGAPFSIIDKVRKGNIIEIESSDGLVLYYEVKGRAIFKKTDVHILGNQGKRELILIACTPKYSLFRRIGIFAELTKIVRKDI